MARVGPPACHANTFFREVGGWERKKVCPACPAPWPTARHHSAHFEARARASLGLPARGLVKQDALVTKFIVTSCSLSRPSVRAPPFSLFCGVVLCVGNLTPCVGAENRLHPQGVNLRDTGAHFLASPFGTVRQSPPKIIPKFTSFLCLLSSGRFAAFLSPPTLAPLRGAGVRFAGAYW